LRFDTSFDAVLGGGERSVSSEHLNVSQRPSNCRDCARCVGNARTSAAKRLSYGTVCCAGIRLFALLPLRDLKLARKNSEVSGFDLALWDERKRSLGQLIDPGPEKIRR